MAKEIPVSSARINYTGQNSASQVGEITTSLSRSFSISGTPIWSEQAHLRRIHPDGVKKQEFFNALPAMILANQAFITADINSPLFVTESARELVAGVTTATKAVARKAAPVALAVSLLACNAPREIPTSVVANPPKPPEAGQCDPGTFAQTLREKGIPTPVGRGGTDAPQIIMDARAKIDACLDLTAEEAAAVTAFNAANPPLDSAPTPPGSSTEAKKEFNNGIVSTKIYEEADYISWKNLNGVEFEGIGVVSRTGEEFRIPKNLQVAATERLVDGKPTGYRIVAVSKEDGSRIEIHGDVVPLGIGPVGKDLPAGTVIATSGDSGLNFIDKYSQVIIFSRPEDMRAFFPRQTTESPKSVTLSPSVPRAQSSSQGATFFDVKAPRPGG